MLNAVIVDDEQNGREVLEILLNQNCPDINVVSSVATINEAIGSIIKNKPDLLFLDIELDNGTGFEILSNQAIEALNLNVIFTTAYEQYAIEAIKNNAIDYLLKPIDVNELKQAVAKTFDKAQPNIKQFVNTIKSSINDNQKLKLTDRKGFQLVDVKNIIYCKSEINYTRFYFDDGSTILTSKTLRTYQERLENSNFMRIHKSHIVNLRKVKKFIHGKVGQVVMHNEETLDISKDLKHDFLEKLDTL